MTTNGPGSTLLRRLQRTFLAPVLRGAMALVLGSALAAPLPLAALEGGASPQAEREAALAQVLVQLVQGGKDGAPRELWEEGTPALLEKAWTLAGDWAAAELNAHPGLPAKTLAKALATLAERLAPVWAGKAEQVLQVEALRLEQGTYVLGLTSAPAFAGTFLVLDRGPGGFHVAWRVLDLARAHFARRDAIGHWAFLSSRGYGSGPLYGTLHPLARDAAGRPRFLVVANQNADGNEQMGQLGFWGWDGTQAQPLLVENFWQASEWWRLRFLPNRVIVGTKEHLRTMYSCAACPEPQATWVVDVTRGKVSSRPRRLRIPEYPAVDELFARVLHREDASALAAPAVIAALTALIPPFDPASDTGDDPSLGMLERARRTRRGKRCLLRLTFDEATLCFTLERRAGRPWFTALAVAKNGT